MRKDHAMHRIPPILTLAAVLFATPALAGEGHSWKVGNDSYSIYSTGLTLNTAAGRAAMLARVEKAARKLCDTGVEVARRRCVDEVVSRTVAAPVAAPLRLAMAERAAVRLAAR
jgi:UrcA family protein